MFYPSDCKTFLGNSVSALEREIYGLKDGIWSIDNTEFNPAALLLLHSKYLEITWFCVVSPADAVFCRAHIAGL